MCGFAGYLVSSTSNGAVDASVARRMADRIAHRGPDDAGEWCDPAAGVALAHRRLSVLDLSPAGHQPMHSASGRWVLTYNGEIYNHLELRRRLESEGMSADWRGHSDSETLLAAVEAWGVESMLKQSAGMFALALWDRAERTLYLARDRMGEKPLYYGWQGGILLFASQPTALRAHPAFAASVDRSALALLLRRNYVPAPRSIYSGISKLLPGTFMRVSPDRADMAPIAYWSLARVAENGTARLFTGSDADALDGLQQRLGDAVRGQMLADVPLGALLSGGIDSSLVVALMQSHGSRPVRTFTIGFSDRAYDESTNARTIATHLRTEHTELMLSGRDALTLVPQLPTLYDEPFADASQLPTHLVMKLARAGVTVALSGDGGDEIFGGYNRYVAAPAVWRQLGWLPASIRGVLGRLLTAVPAPLLNRLLGGISHRLGVAQPGDKAHKLGLRLQHVQSVDDLYLALVSEWSQASDVLLHDAGSHDFLDDRGRWPTMESPAARMMLLDALTYLPGDILTKVDRAAMAVSLETRAPYLDRDVVEFAWTLPMHMKIRGGQGKWLLRQLLYRHVPRELVERPKMGFGIPLDSWLRGPLRDWAETLLDARRLRDDGFFRPETIRKTWQRHLAGEAFGYRLWSVLMFQAWFDAQRL